MQSLVRPRPRPLAPLLIALAMALAAACASGDLIDHDADAAEDDSGARGDDGGDDARGTPTRDVNGGGRDIGGGSLDTGPTTDDVTDDAPDDGLPDGAASDIGDADPGDTATTVDTDHETSIDVGDDTPTSTHDWPPFESTNPVANEVVAASRQATEAFCTCCASTSGGDAATCNTTAFAGGVPANECAVAVYEAELTRAAVDAYLRCLEEGYTALERCVGATCTAPCHVCQTGLTSKRSSCRDASPTVVAALSPCEAGL